MYLYLVLAGGPLHSKGIPFVLGHALYMKAIHGGKAKNDKIDAPKIAVLLRGGMIPQAYVYPAEMRSTRDLLRRRMHLMHKRAELLSHIQNTNHQYNRARRSPTRRTGREWPSALRRVRFRKALKWTWR
jgi:Transposase